MKRLLYFFSFLLFISSTTLSQDNFSVDAYKSFLQSNQNITSQQLYELYPAGTYKAGIQSSPGNILYLDSLEIKFELTSYEKELLKKNGFMVSERIPMLGSFGACLSSIYHNDVPLFISTDAILHAFHASYDGILMRTEQNLLKAKLEEYLNLLRGELSILKEKYSSSPDMIKNIRDVDLYLSIPLHLLNSTTEYLYTENNEQFAQLLDMIADEQPQEVNIFSENPRKIDFSQFKPRGHYTQDPELEKYFRAMIWLGKIELYLTAPKSLENTDNADVQRQTIDAVLISELASSAEALTLYNEIETIISFFVGEQDNVDLENLISLKEELTITEASQLLDTLVFQRLQDSLSTKSYAVQKILSQILYSDPYSPGSIVPASAFMLFGQRFVVDSYVTNNVTFDRIIYNNEKIKRMLPSSLDMLFALGNNAAGILLKDELDNYKYSYQVAALRYLIDSYENEFWESSIYNMWLGLIRSLNMNENREQLPEFMQTAAFGQQKMNTQLASWTELRHDNLLYAKQSYSGGATCSFPYVYVEPIPQFYSTLSTYAKIIGNKFAQILPNTTVPEYFDYLAAVADTLNTVAEKELSGTPFTDQEKKFLCSMLYDRIEGCEVVFDGWYPNLYYMDLGSAKLKDPERITADYHTAPTDEFGNVVGWVKHAGTGNVNYAVVIASLPGGEPTSFIGPVLSFYEYTSVNFLRLSDKEWADEYLSSALRPDWTNIYLASATGDSRGSGPSLVTSVNDEDIDSAPESYKLSAINYPNPFNSSTKIKFTIPTGFAGKTTIKIYDIKGELIKVLFDSELGSGNYIIDWNGYGNSSQIVPSGVYFYEVKAGSESYTGKLVMMK